jgi:hypothetical protein
MTVDEAWTQLRTRLVELVGMSGAEILMDRPHGGWGDLVTNHTLDLRFAAFEERSDRKLDALEARMELRFAAVDAQFAEIRSGVEAGFAAVDHKFDLLRAEMQTQGADLRAQGAELRAEMYRRFRSQTLVMVSTFTALAGVIVAAIRL